MKVTVSVLGRFWAFNLAGQLYRRGHLRRLITTYPKFETVKYGVPRSHIVSLLPIEGFNRSWHKAPAWLKDRYDPRPLVHNATDRLAAAWIPEDTDIFVGWSGVSLHSLRRAREYGAVTVVERGSSHMRYQTAILREEYEKFGASSQITHPDIYEKELQEYEEADYVAVPSSFVKSTFLEEGVSANKLLHLPFGVEISDFRPVPKEDNTFRVIHCGGLTLRKGVHYLLAAFAELDLRDAELWLIGSMTEEIRPFLKKYANARVFHRGPYPQRELHRYYSQGSVFCLASIEEGLAMVIPQAMACGLPVVCTTNTGGADIVREGLDGFIVPIRDVPSLKERLLKLYENPDLRTAMGRSARERVSLGFTWDHYGTHVETCYRELLRA